MSRIFKLTEAQVRNLDDNMYGLCATCGEEANGCEPDAREYHCDVCETPTVYGAMELLIMGRIEIIE